MHSQLLPSVNPELNRKCVWGGGGGGGGGGEGDDDGWMDG